MNTSPSSSSSGLSSFILRVSAFLTFLLIAVPVFAADYFSSGGSFVIGDRPDYLAVGDVTGDGVVDLVAGNVGHYSAGDGGFVGRNVSVFEGDGSGGFVEFDTVDVADVPEAVAIADVNGDSVSEILLATADDGVTVLVKNGSTFTTLGPFACGSVPVSIAVADMNDDDEPDIVTANNGSDNVSVLLGNGDGTFGAAQNYACGTAPADVCVVDLDGDDLPDVAVANNFGGTVSVFMNGPAGTLAKLTDVEVGSAPQALAAGHFGGSAAIDLAVGDFVDDNVTLLLGNGDGSFDSGGRVLVGEGVNDLWAANLNNVGLDELLVAANDNTFRVYRYSGTQFELGESHGTGVTPISIIAANLNGDAWEPDAAVAAYSDGVVTLFWRNEIATVGDVDGNGEVNAIDVQLVINAALGLDIGGLDADVDDDGDSDAVDVQLTINGALGIKYEG